MKANQKHAVLAIGLEYPLSLRGGVSVLVESLVAGLADRWKVVLVSPEETRKLDGHPLRPLVFHHIPFYQPTKPPNRAFAKDRDALISRLRELEVEILHLHCGGVYGWGNRWPRASVARAARRAGLRVFWTDHLVVSLFDGYCGKNKPFWLKLAMLPVGWLGKLDQMASVEREIAVSEHDRRKLARWYFPFRGRLRRTYHSRLAELPCAESFTRSPIILSVGHVAFRKGQHILAGAFADIAGKYPLWELWIAGHNGGDGCWRAIEEIIQANGLENRIFLLGPRDDAQELMRKASLFVQPSLEEALGLALQEALSAGCVCIGTDAGGIPELISHGKSGLLVPKNDVARMSRALDLLIADNSFRESLSRQAPSELGRKNMNVSGMIGAHNDLYLHH